MGTVLTSRLFQIGLLTTLLEITGKKPARVEVRSEGLARTWCVLQMTREAAVSRRRLVDSFDFRR
jgi:hypothetical protein